MTINATKTDLIALWLPCSIFAPHLENHAQYTCLRIAEAFTTEIKLSDRWVVGLELGNWDATELLQRLALLLSNMTLPME